MTSLFHNYPYKTFQLRSQGMEPEKAADFFLSRVGQSRYYLSDTEKPEDASYIFSHGPLEPLFSRYPLKAHLCKNFLFDKSIQSNFRTALKQYLKDLDYEVMVFRTAIDDRHAISLLTDLEATYICSESIYTLKLKAQTFSDRFNNWSSIEEANEGDKDSIESLSQLNHYDNRFLKDERFNSKKIKALFGNIASDSLAKAGHKVWVFREKGQVLGFITVIINKAMSEAMGVQLASLDYIAVGAEAQGKNIGTALNDFALNALKEAGVEYVSVKTLANNYPAQKILVKSGFFMSSQNMILHLWK